MNLRLQSPFHLHGVGPAYTWKLAMCGVETIEEIADCQDLEDLSYRSSISLGLLKRIQLKAQVMVSGKVVKIQPFNLPSSRLLYLDIETTPYGRVVWLIGYMAEGVAQIYASDFDLEKTILCEFLQVLKMYDKHAIVTWSTFDTRVLQSRMRFHGLNPEPLTSMIKVDLKHLIRRSFIFPTRGYGLKTIGSFLGYQFSNPGLNGLEVALKYEEHIAKCEPIDPKVFSYNIDDVKILPFIKNWARAKQTTYPE
jgi:predicted RecB family nuclease